MQPNELEKLIPLEDITKNTSLQKSKYIDDEGYLYSLSRSNLSTIKKRITIPAKFFNLNPYTTENIENYLIINKIPLTLIRSDNIKTAKSRITFKCDIHGEFEKSWNEIKNGAYCAECAKENQSHPSRHDYEFIKAEFDRRGYTLLTSEYKNNLQTLDFTCPKHKDEIQHICWANFLTQGCKFCSLERQIIKATKTDEQFRKELEALHGDKFTLLEKYTKANNKIKIHCNDCNSDFYQKASHLLEGYLGCNCREKSFGEKLIKEYFQDEHVDFEQEYRFPDCRNIKPLPFDFAIFNKEKVIIYMIEFQGRQHYSDTHWSKDIEKSAQAFKQRQINDNIKRQYCMDKKIKLLEIPYWEIKNINEILSNN
ncbi:hypothetical protein [Clostridium estertheticum]|uniref:hypothetical protein n=1 Tax=Clostridium estertheticum TaxID=238834 RepID=UPI001C0CDE16|nr:hypothetical protein [Clostridium estertheticum]MBU3186667.1 hypothetical protein [Clostridium estertheticum]